MKKLFICEPFTGEISDIISDIKTHINDLGIDVNSGLLNKVEKNDLLLISNIGLFKLNGLAPCIKNSILIQRLDVCKLNDKYSLELNKYKTIITHSAYSKVALKKYGNISNVTYIPNFWFNNKIDVEKPKINKPIRFTYTCINNEDDSYIDVVLSYLVAFSNAGHTYDVLLNIVASTELKIKEINKLKRKFRKPAKINFYNMFDDVKYNTDALILVEPFMSGKKIIQAYELNLPVITLNDYTSEACELLSIDTAYIINTEYKNTKRKAFSIYGTNYSIPIINDIDSFAHTLVNSFSDILTGKEKKLIYLDKFSKNNIINNYVEFIKNYL